MEAAIGEGGLEEQEGWKGQPPALSHALPTTPQGPVTPPSTQYYFSSRRCRDLPCSRPCRPSCTTFALPWHALPPLTQQVLSRLVLQHKVEKAEEIVLLPREAIEQAAEAQAEKFLSVVSSALAPPARTLQQVRRTRISPQALIHLKISEQVTAKISGGDAHLDRFLRGGFPSKGIVEVRLPLISLSLLLPSPFQISGEAGSGKTALALQICCTSLLAGEEAGAVFLSTQPFPAPRWEQIVQARCPDSHTALSARLFVSPVPTADRLLVLIRFDDYTPGPDHRSNCSPRTWSP